MKLIQPFSPKHFTDIQPGELFIWNVRGEPATSIGLVSPAGSEKKRTAILKSVIQQENKPTWVEFSPLDTWVISYGVDWCLDLTNVGQPGSRDYYNSPGCVEVRPGCITMDFAAGGSGFLADSISVDLGTFDLAFNLVHDSSVTPVPNWRIWLNAEDSQKVTGRPFFEFKANPSQ